MVKGRKYVIFNYIFILISSLKTPFTLFGIWLSYSFLDTVDDIGTPVNDYIHYKELSVSIVSLIGVIACFILSVIFFKQNKTYKSPTFFLLHLFSFFAGQLDIFIIIAYLIFHIKFL
jgi:hypothetical protein